MKRVDWGGRRREAGRGGRRRRSCAGRQGGRMELRHDGYEDDGER